MGGFGKAQFEADFAERQISVQHQSLAFEEKAVGDDLQGASFAVLCKQVAQRFGRFEHQIGVVLHLMELFEVVLDQQLLTCNYVELSVRSKSIKRLR